jgi:putative transposase
MSSSSAGMVILEFRLVGARRHFAALDEAIRTTQFIRNKCVRLWHDARGTPPADLNKYCRAVTGHRGARNGATPEVRVDEQRYCRECVALYTEEREWINMNWPMSKYCPACRKKKWPGKYG